MALRPAGSLKEVTPAEQVLIDKVQTFRHDPLGFVHYVFGWGEGELAGMDGPDKWQSDYLEKLGRLSEDNIDGVVKMAVASGHGVGKTAMVSWIILWFMSTRDNPAIVVTANTQNQLTTKTWRELSKWHKLAINRHWFEHTATKFFHTLERSTWAATATPWSENNSEAFAGTHEKRGTMVVMDEASAISDVIWEVVEGAMTTAGSFWVVFGNPTKATGRFYDCFHDQKHRWHTYKVDSRNAAAAQKAQIQAWLEDYGEDSDFFKVRVRGEFPSQALNQFIPSDLIQEAQKRRLPKEAYAHNSYSIGVDVARFGGDTSVIAVRQGKILLEPIYKFSGIDTMELAGRVIQVYRQLGGNAVVCVDGVGVGAGVVDRLRQLGLRVIDVQSAAKPQDGRTYYNKRGELYGRLKEWLINGGVVPINSDLAAQLRVLEYQINKKLQIQLASKDDLRPLLNGQSPDIADALAYTFAADEMIDFARFTTARKVVAMPFY